VVVWTGTVSLTGTAAAVATGCSGCVACVCEAVVVGADCNGGFAAGCIKLATAFCTRLAINVCNTPVTIVFTGLSAADCVVATAEVFLCAGFVGAASASACAAVASGFAAGVGTGAAEAD
jgi:hypothetical protein